MAQAVKVAIKEHAAEILAAVSAMTEDGTLCDCTLGEHLKASSVLLLTACTKGKSMATVKSALASSTAALNLIKFIHHRKVTLTDKKALFELFELSHTLGVEDCERACQESLKTSGPIVLEASPDEDRRFVQKLCNAYEQRSLCDGHIQVYDEKEKMITFRLNVHKVIVGSVAAYFKPLWTGHFDNVDQDTWEAPSDITKQQMMEILNLIYKGEAHISRNSDMLSLYLLMDRLCVLQNMANTVLQLFVDRSEADAIKRYVGIEAPCPIALRRACLEKLLGIRGEFEKHAKLDTYVCMLDMEATGTLDFSKKEWLKFPRMLNSVGILEAPCLSLLGVQSVVRLFACLRGCTLSLFYRSSEVLSAGTLVFAKENFTTHDKEKKLSIKAGQRGNVVCIDADGDARVKFLDSGGVHRVRKDGFSKLAVVSNMSIKVRTIKALSTTSGCTISPNTLAVIGKMHTDGFAMSLLNDMSSHEVNLRYLGCLEVADETLKLDANMLIAALVRWSRDCREASPEGALQAWPEICRLNSLFRELASLDIDSILCNEFNTAFKQLLGCAEKETLATSCNILQICEDLTDPLRSAAESLVSEELSKLVNEEVQFSVVAGLKCSVNACKWLLREERDMLIMHAAAKAARSYLAQVAKGQVTFQCVLNILRLGDLSVDEVDALVTNLCDHNFDSLLDAMCDSDYDLKLVIRNGMSLWRKRCLSAPSNASGDASCPKRNKTEHEASTAA